MGKDLVERGQWPDGALGNAGLHLCRLKLYRHRYKHRKVQYRRENTRTNLQYRKHLFMVQGAAECRADVEEDGVLAAAEETALNNILTFFAYFFTIINAVFISC